MFARFLLIALTALTTGAAHAVTFVPLAGEITVTTSPDRREASVAVANMGMVTALFCIAFAEPLDQPIRLEEKGQIIFCRSRSKAYRWEASSRASNPSLRR